MRSQNYDNIDFQGLASIVRDFDVFIPSCCGRAPEYGAETCSERLYLERC
ncbi:WzyE family oligosaccharide polymerase [Shigella flexneri]